LDDGTCPGNCNARYRREQARYHQALAAYDPLDSATSRPESPSIRPMAGHPWCLECQAVIRVQLGQLDLLAALRRDTADGYPADAGTQRVSGSRDSLSPSPGHDDVDDTARMLAGWEAAYRDHKGWPSAPRHGDMACQRTECIAWLSERLDAILTSPLAADFGAEVQQWHAELKAKTKAGVRRLRKPLRCPRSMGGCGLLMLTWTEGGRNVECSTPGCGLLLPLEVYYATVEAVAAGFTNGESDDHAAALLAVRP
jgi:hypothetical protein